MNAYLYSQIIKLFYESYFNTKVKRHKPKLLFKLNNKKKKTKKYKKYKKIKTKKSKKKSKNKQKVQKKNKTLKKK